MTQLNTISDICVQLELGDGGFLSEYPSRTPQKVIHELTPYFKLYNLEQWASELAIHFDVDISHSPAYWSDVTGGSPEEHSDERTVTHAELILTHSICREEIKHVHAWACGISAYENQIIYAIQAAFAATIQEAEVHFPEPDEKYDTDPRV